MFRQPATLLHRSDFAPTIAAADRRQDRLRPTHSDIPMLHDDRAEAAINSDRGRQCFVGLFYAPIPATKVVPAVEVETDRLPHQRARPRTFSSKCLRNCSMPALS